MPRVRTHYDNLKVARNAPTEVIRAAYRALSQKFHPDQNPGNPEAARIMTIINASYEVLSDPDKRQAHDRWIDEQEQAAAHAETAATQSSPNPQHNPSQESVASSGGFVGVLAHVLRYWFLYGIAGFIIWISVSDKPHPPSPGPKPYQATPPALPPKPAWGKPKTAPNGQPWPNTAAYVKGYQRLHTDGLSSVTVDNSRNDSDVLVKLVSLDGPKAYPVRTFFIPAHGTFTLNKVRAGTMIFDIAI